MKSPFDVIVVGSGAGGASVAYELAKRKKSVLVLEAGPEVRGDRLGTMLAAAVHPGYFKRMAIFSRSVEGSLIYHTCNLGGSTVFACGNMVRNRAVEKRLVVDFGMAGLAECLDEAENESLAQPLPMGSISGFSKGLMEAARRIGYDARSASKGLVDGVSCAGCGKCVLGCRRGAKWDSRHYLASAATYGAAVRSGTRVEPAPLRRQEGDRSCHRREGTH